MKEIPIIDPHIHIWDTNKYEIPWMRLPEMSCLKRNFTLADYQKAIEGINIVKAVYIEINVTFSQLTLENQEIIEICKDPDTIIDAAVIGGDMVSENFEEYIDPYTDSPYVKGVRRVTVFEDTPPGYCLQPRFMKNVEILGKKGLSFDLCMRPDELLDGVQLIDACPDTQFIFDHIGNVGLKTDHPVYDKWLKGIIEMGKRENVVCKVSGMTEQHEHDRWKSEDLIPNFHRCLEAFGEDRILFASNWPVVTLKATLKRYVEGLEKILKEHSEDFRYKFFYENALRAYRL